MKGVSRKTLQRALARHELQQREAVPTAKAVLAAFRGGLELPVIPESGEELPDCYPYTVLPEHLARQLLFLAAAVPDQAPELQGLFLCHPELT